MAERDSKGQKIGHTLADGKPGSRRPLADAKPDRAHSGSIAADPDPHRENKLSSTDHESPDRDGTLATGKPGSERPVVDAGADED